MQINNRVYFKRLMPFLLMFVAIVHLQGCSRSEQLSPLHADAVILAFGDSLTAGYGVPKQQAYPAVLESLSGFKVINAGVSGEKTQQGLARLQKLLETESFDLVILFEGGNDILQKRPYEEIAGNLQKMIELLQANQKQILLIGVPEKKLFSDSAPFYEAHAEQYQLPLENEIVGDLMVRASMKSDYVHFNAKGYQALAQAIYLKLQDSGAITK